jgi:peptidyl-prolyl cis-trans isomerase D
MALISQIRKNGAWVLVVLIALGLLGFIIQDMTVGQTSVFGSMQPTVGKVEGQKIDINDFNRTESILYANSTADIFGRRSALWEYYVEKILVDKEANSLGLGVSKTELLDLQFGPDPSPIIVQRFTDPVTGQVNREQLGQLKQMISSNTLQPDARSYWAIQEKEIIKDRLQKKVEALVSKGLYTPAWMAEATQKENTSMLNVHYVRIPFDEVDNSDVTLSDDDYEQYLKAHASNYEVEKPTRKISFLTFDVKASKQDSATHRNKISALLAEFRSTPNDTAFIERNQGIFDGTFVKKEAVSPVIADSVFSRPVGTVLGPYIDGGAFKAVKIVGRQVIADSVRSRHILIRATDAATLAAARTKVDSLKKEVEAGRAKFEDLAKQFSQDGSSLKGGDLGYTSLGGMVKPFNDLIFFKAEQGKVYSVETQFGVHLVEVTGKKSTTNASGVRLAYLSQSITPSDETQRSIYDKAQAFLASHKGGLEDLESAVKKQKSLKLENGPGVTENDYFLGSLGSGQQVRDIIKWAFTANAGQVSPELYTFTDAVEFFDSKYVIAALKTIQKPGPATVAQVKEELEPLVLNYKKGEIISGKIKSKNLSSIASQFKSKIDTLPNMRFTMSFIPNLGNEPKVLGEAYRLNQGQVSKPIIGNSGVVVLEVVGKTPPTLPPSLFELQSSMASNTRSQVATKLMQAIKKKANIKDNRSKFF